MTECIELELLIYKSSVMVIVKDSDMGTTDNTGSIECKGKSV